MTEIVTSEEFVFPTKVNIFHDGNKVYYGKDLMNMDISKLTKVEVDINIPPESFYLENGVLKHNYVPKTQEFLNAEFQVKMYLDQTAQSYGYDNIHTAALRASYAGPYQQEGIAFATWMDNCWKAFYDGDCDITNWDTLTGSLPKLSV